MTFAPTLPAPSSHHATCAWCRLELATVVELIDHVDALHLVDKGAIVALAPWHPTAEEVAAIVREMRPIIVQLAERDRLGLASTAGLRS
jgi:hypothetical protein